MVAWAKPTSVPSGILIHLTVWPQQTWTEKWGLHLFLCDLRQDLGGVV